MIDSGNIRITSTVDMVFDLFKHNQKDQTLKCTLIHACLDYDNFTLILKSGKETLFERVYLQNMTFGHKFKNQVVISDESRSIGDLKIWDVYLMEISKPHNINMHNVDGWHRDAHKFLPGWNLAYELNKKSEWYLMTDDDTYIFTETMLMFFSRLDPLQVKRIGWTYFAIGNCGQNSRSGSKYRFLHGGNGVFLSHQTLDKLTHYVDKCIVKYSDCGLGDVIVSLCLQDMGIYEKKTSHPQGYWKIDMANADQGWPNKKDKCVCPFAAHRLRNWDHQSLYRVEQDLHSRKMKPNFGLIFRTIFTLNGTLIKNVSDHEIFYFNNTRKWTSSNTINIIVNKTSWNDCAVGCIGNQDCVLFIWENMRCALYSEIGTIAKNDNSKSL